MLHRSMVTLVLATVAHLLPFRHWMSQLTIDRFDRNTKGCNLRQPRHDPPSQIEFSIRGNVADVSKIREKLRFYFRRAK